MAYGRRRSYGRKRFGGYRKGYSRFPKRGRSGMGKAPYMRKGYRPSRRSTLNTGLNELKAVDVISTANPPSQTIAEQIIAIADVPYCLNDVINGTDFNQRIGRKIVIKSVDIKLQLRPYTADAAKGLFVRCLLVWDRTPNGVALAASSSLNEVLTDVGATGTAFAGATGYGCSTHPNLSNRDRFIVLRDKTIAVQPFEISTTPNSYSGTATTLVHIRKKLNATTIFNNTTSSATPLGTHIQTGRLVFFMLPSVDSLVGAIMSARVRYIDS